MKSEILADLSNEESHILALVFSGVNNGKAGVYDAQTKLEDAQAAVRRAQKELVQAESRAQAALSVIGDLHKIEGSYGVSADLKKLERR